MRFPEQGSRSNKSAILWASNNRSKFFLDLEGYLRELALRVTWRSVANTTSRDKEIRRTRRYAGAPGRKLAAACHVAP
jgi:hypothetical protein